jgi:hypothetical protein
LLTVLNNCWMTIRIPSIWEDSQIINEEILNFWRIWDHLMLRISFNFGLARSLKRWSFVISDSLQAWPFTIHFHGQDPAKGRPGHVLVHRNGDLVRTVLGFFGFGLTRADDSPIHAISTSNSFVKLPVIAHRQSAALINRGASTRSRSPREAASIWHRLFRGTRLSWSHLKAQGHIPQWIPRWWHCYGREASILTAFAFHPTRCTNDWRSERHHVANLTIPKPAFNKPSILHTIYERRCILEKRYQSDATVLQRSELMDQRHDTGCRTWVRQNPGIISEMVGSRTNSEKTRESEWWRRIWSSLVL